MERTPAEALFLELPKDWKQVTDEIFNGGGTDVEAFVAISLGRKDHNELMKIEEYAEHFDNGMSRAEAWWSNWARMNINAPSKDVNTKIFSKVMDTFFAWNDRAERKEEKKDKKENTVKTVNKFEQKFKLVSNGDLTKNK